MIENIRVSFKQLLKGVEWMDGESKKKAEEKVKRRINTFSYA